MDLATYIQLALAEDIGRGDHSSLACVPQNATEKARLLVKDEGVLAGLNMAKAIYATYDSKLNFNPLLNDGDWVRPGEVAFELSGPARSILAVERLSLNIMQHMSGIATATQKVMQQLEGTGCRILDTRKTSPLNRFLQKEAVSIGGGMNHRFGLYDMIMLKDNHIDYAGGIAAAIHRTKAYLQENQLDLKIEVEARSLNEVNEILAVGGIHRIMLDNFNFEDLRTAVKLINKQYETEASGGIEIEQVREYALCGVDFISMGALTHSVKNFDLSLKAIKNV
ncbi:MAG: carboxylating nicotinate-nucleotide diphosphorylase [Bacteroidia bacterium]